MATGFDARESTRRSFAFQPRQPVQTNNQVAASPVIGRSGVVMQGQNTGGVVMSQAPTLQGDAGGELPEFLNKVLEPHIQAQQQRRFREGYTARLMGDSVEDINARQPGLSAIFGPTDFQKGSIFFSTQTAVNDWQADQLSNMPALAAMAPEELPRYLNDEMEKQFTGDTVTDNAIAAAILEAQQTLVPRITQARLEREQRVLQQGAVANVVSAAGAYDALIASYVRQPEAEDGQPDPLAGTRIDEAAIQRGKETFLSHLLPVDGMTPEAYKTTVEQAARGALANGNLWAYNAMREGGANSVLFATLDADTIQSLDSAYRTAGQEAQARAMAAIGPAYDEFRTRVRLGQVPPGEIRERLNEFNVRIATLSGYTEPYFDSDAAAAQVESGVNDLISNFRRDEERSYQERQRQLNRQEEEAAKAEEDRQTLASILTLSETGDLQAATLTYGAEKVNQVFTAAIRTTPQETIPRLVASHRNSSTIVDGVRDVLQSQVTANIGAGYDSQSFQMAYANWKLFDSIPGGQAARAAYYGQYDNMFARMTTLMANGTGITGTVAYAQTFGEAGALLGTQRPAAMPTGERQQRLQAALERETEPSFFQRFRAAEDGGAFTLSRNARITLGRLVMGGAAARIEADPSLNERTAIQNEIAALQADRRIEIVGSDAWANPGRGASLSTLSGVPTDRLGMTWDALVKEGLARVDQRGRPYSVYRSGVGPESRFIIVTTPDANHQSAFFEINVPMVTAHYQTHERQDAEARQNRQRQPRTYQGAGSVDRR